MSKKNLERRISSLSSSLPEYIRGVVDSFEIRESREVASAATRVGEKAILLINPEFVEKHCKSEAHLLMLILHEAFHIILGHTRLFGKKATFIDNLAFDAVVNASLCKLFPQKMYVSFFMGINPSSSFPGCLLRPIEADTPKECLVVLSRLYSSDTSTYEDIYSLIEDLWVKLPHKEGYILLGEEGRGEYSPYMKKWAKALSKSLLSSGEAKASLASSPLWKSYVPRPPEKEVVKKMKRLLHYADIIPEKRKENVPIYGEIPIFSYGDRRAFLKEEISYPLLPIYTHPLKGRKKEEDGEKALVYLDVSGSMEEALPSLLPLFASLLKKKRCLLYGFSSRVEELNEESLLEGEYLTSGATDFDCIMDHYLSLEKPPRKILIISDGLSSFSEEMKEKMKEKGLSLYVGYIGKRIDLSSLAPLARKVVRLE